MTRKLIFYVIMFGLVFFVFEGFGFISQFIMDDVYDHRDEVLNKLSNDDEVVTNLKRMDPVLGWQYHGPDVHSECNCQGTSVTYSFDRNGARTYRGFGDKPVEIVLVGDSYTHGSEVTDDDTFSAQLSSILGVSIANLGVGGFGPVQAFLNLKRKLPDYPEAGIVMLGIMYENIFRMVNSYRPVLAHKSSPYRIKPYIAKGDIQQPAPNVFSSVDSLKRQANYAFDHDFWAKPRHEFPFSVAFIRSMGSRYCLHKRLPRKLRKIGMPEYFLAYRSEAFCMELIRLLGQYAAFAHQNHVRPVVIFIPRDRHDTKSVAAFIETNREQFDPDLLICDIGNAHMDWERYNLVDSSKKGNINLCHPSPYGHRMMAEYIAGFLNERNVLVATSGL